MATVYLGLGSNVDAERNLALAVRELRSRYGTVDLSPVFRSRPVGFEGDDFLNLVARLDTSETPEEMLARIEVLHGLAGRDRRVEKGRSRPLDIDLLLYDDLVDKSPPLKLPRGDILKYAFVLKPLALLAPGLTHPETGRTMRAHWQEVEAGAPPLWPVRLEL